MRQFLKLCLQSGLLLMLITLAGCSSKTTDPSAVTPPESNGAVGGSAVDSSGTPAESTPATALGGDPQAEPASQLDAPGQLELPAGDIPEATDQAAPPGGSGGLEMPIGIEVPQSNLMKARETIRYAEWEEIEQEVTRSGQLTVVDVWSLSCQPCLEEFPGLVRLDQELGSKVRCISVDVDFDGRKTRPPESYEDRVATFLAEVGATFSTYISQTASDEIFAKLDLASIPAVLVYDANGALIKRFVDAGETTGFSYDADVIPFIKQL